MSNLRQELAAALNRHSAENGSNTPDFILADFLALALNAFDQATVRRDGWVDASGRVNQPVEEGSSPPLLIPRPFPHGFPPNGPLRMAFDLPDGDDEIKVMHICIEAMCRLLPVDKARLTDPEPTQANHEARNNFCARSRILCYLGDRFK